MKKTTIIFGIATFFALALTATSFAPKTAFGCGWFSDCSTDTSNIHTFMQESAKTEVNQRGLEVAQPVPTLEDSVERANLIKRLNLFNNPSKLSYIYLLSYGKVMAFYTIKGKVSSLNSLLTNPTQLIDPRDGSGCLNVKCEQVASPDLDGTYGQNGPEGTIFFFTTEGAYVEWHGDYMMSDQPLQLATQPELVRTVK